jgi:tetratricopeptide (TPR) repeat protein
MAVLSKALRLEPGLRESHVRMACGNDEGLFEEIMDAVEWEERMGSFMKHPLIVTGEIPHRFEPHQLISERFEIIREIGEGGMGIVYEALDRKRNQRIAIKVAKPGFHCLLSPELEGALRVRHPNVCLVNEIHTAQTPHGEVDFLTMELLEGETLSARVSAHGKLQAEEALDIARQLCEGLAEAHRSHVIHGDLKAANVIVCQTESNGLRAVITDFGLSGEAAQTGALCGTPAYMAPELWLGHKASRASDIYALGVLLREITAGRPSTDDSTVLPCVQARPLPKSYSRLVGEFLSHDPDRRCRAFDQSFEVLAPKRRPWTRRRLLATGAGAIFAVAVAGWTERTAIENQFHPLPRKRFVALLAWPPAQDARAKQAVNGVIDAIENELARAEASDRDLFVISSHDAIVDGSETARIRRIRDSLGANLVLEASAIPDVRRFRLQLTVRDASTGAVLRNQQLNCATGEIASLSGTAVRAAAQLLNVSWQEDSEHRLKPSTHSADAFRAFQQAEELRKEPNDDGLDAAIENYKKAIDVDPHYSGAYAKLSLAYSRLYALHRDAGALGLAQANAEKALELDPQSSDGHLALAYVYEKKNNQEKALDEVDRALKVDPTNPRTLLWKAQIYHRFQRWAEAEQAYLRLKRERPNYWLAYQELGVLFNTQGRYQEAIQAFHAAAVLAPGSSLPVNNLGALHLKLGNVREAEEYFRRSLTLKPNDLAYSNLAEALRAEGKHAEAIRYSREAVKLNPSNDLNWLGLADGYDSIRGQEKRARQTYLKAASEVERRLRTETRDGSSLMRLALYRRKSRSREDQLSLVKQAEQYGASDLDSQLVKVRVLELAGRRTEALSTLDNCFKRGTTMFEVASITDLTALRKDPAYARIVRAAKSN